MNTNTTVLLAAVILGGAIVAATLIASGNHEAGPSDSTPAPTAGTSTEAGGTPPPGLRAVGTDERVARLERELESARAQIARLSEASGASPAHGARPRSETEHASLRAQFFSLSQAYRDGSATKEQAAELIRLTKDDAFMARVVADLESHIADNPQDVDARMQLVDVQSARLHSAGSITERTLLAGGVRQQIDAVLKVDANNWRARYSRAVGISHSQRTPQGRANAAREFEALIELQQTQPGEARFADTYTQLAGVYMADQKKDEARRTLQGGLARHPDSQAIKDLLASLDANR
jgi:hypothetical protein